MYSEIISKGFVYITGLWSKLPYNKKLITKPKERQKYIKETHNQELISYPIIKRKTLPLNLLYRKSVLQ